MTDIPLLIFVGALGLVIGSFLNVCIGRLPAGESVVSPGSRCPSCRKAIVWYDNVPVLSYLVLGARCRNCRAPISARYPATEAITAALFVVQAMVVPASEPILLAQRLLLTAILIVLFGTDLETQRLPNVITLPGIVIGAIFSLFVLPGIVDSLAGIALGASVLLAIRWGWKAATGVDGMGLGDVKMLAMVGAFLGWKNVIVVLFLSSVVGAVVGIALTALRGRSMTERIPFGTFIALAAFVASLVGDAMMRWYLSSFS